MSITRDNLFLKENSGIFSLKVFTPKSTNEIPTFLSFTIQYTLTFNKAPHRPTSVIYNNNKTKFLTLTNLWAQQKVCVDEQPVEKDPHLVEQCIYSFMQTTKCKLPLFKKGYLWTNNFIIIYVGLCVQATCNVYMCVHPSC